MIHAQHDRSVIERSLRLVAESKALLESTKAVSILLFERPTQLTVEADISATKPAASGTPE